MDCAVLLSLFKLRFEVLLSFSISKERRVILPKSHSIFNSRTSTALLLSAFLVLSSCATTNKLALGAVANALAGTQSSTVFTGDDDPELVGESLPVFIKTFEALREQLPHHQGLILQTGSLEVMYANAFVQGPAQRLPADQFDQKRFQLDRALKLYLRADKVLKAGLELRFPGLEKALAEGTAEPLLAKANKNDVPLLYWESAAVMSAFALAPLDVALSVRVKGVTALMARAYALDPNYGDGTLDEFYISFYGALPDGLGGSKVLAKRHFDTALLKDKGQEAGPYLAYVQAVSLPNQNFPEFKKLLKAALAIDVDKDPSHRLVNILAQTEARWLLAHKDDLFLDTGDTP